MPAVEISLLKSSVQASVASARAKLVTEIESAQKKAKKGYTNAQGASDLATAFSNYEDELLAAVCGNIDTYIQTYMTRVYNTHMHMTTAPGGPTLIPLIPAD